MKTRLLTAFAICATLFSIPAARAQAVYAAFTASRIDSTSSKNWIYGPTVGIYFDHGSVLPVHLGMDVRGQFLSKDGTRVNAGLVGPRVSVVPHVIPFKIYGEALVGVQKLKQQSGSTVTVDHLHFTYQFLGGLEYTFFPRLDWRVAEVSTGYLSNGSQTYHPVNVSTGLVVRF